MEINEPKTPKFKKEDFVTVVQNHVWYTYLDDIRLERVGKTGRIKEVEVREWTREDLEWVRSPLSQFTEISYRVRFSDTREIVFDEEFLKPFELER